MVFYHYIISSSLACYDLIDYFIYFSFGSSYKSISWNFSNQHLNRWRWISGVVFLATQLPLWWVCSVQFIQKNPLAETTVIFTQDMWPFSQVWKLLHPHISFHYVCVATVNYSCSTCWMDTQLLGVIKKGNPQRCLKISTDQFTPLPNVMPHTHPLFSHNTCSHTRKESLNSTHHTPASAAGMLSGSLVFCHSLNETVSS